MIQGRRSARSAYSGRNRMAKISCPANFEMTMPDSPIIAPQARSLPSSELNAARLPVAYDLARRVNADCPRDTTAMFPIETTNPIAANIPTSRSPSACLMKKLGTLEFRHPRSTTIPRGKLTHNNSRCTVKSNCGASASVRENPFA